jgi:hypothetical protein
MIFSVLDHQHLVGEQLARFHVEHVACMNCYVAGRLGNPLCRQAKERNGENCCISDLLHDDFPLIILSGWQWRTTPIDLPVPRIGIRSLPGPIAAILYLARKT